jgi:hypothetical protein
MPNDDEGRRFKLNFTPDFLRSAPFVKFKRGVGKPEALEYLFFLCQRCQLRRKFELNLGDDLDLQLTLNLPDDVDASRARELLVECGFIKQTDESGTYLVQLFLDMNAGLLSRWENGSKGGRPRQNAEAPVRDERPRFATPSYAEETVQF